MNRCDGDPATARPVPARDHAPSRVDSKAGARADRAHAELKAGGRRRDIGPATSGRDFGAAEQAFLRAMQEYRRTSGRMFLTWSETLEVLRSLGYRKLWWPAPPGDSAR